MILDRFPGAAELRVSGGKCPCNGKIMGDDLCFHPPPAMLMFLNKLFHHTFWRPTFSVNCVHIPGVEARTGPRGAGEADTEPGIRPGEWVRTEVTGAATPVREQMLKPLSSLELTSPSPMSH